MPHAPLGVLDITLVAGNDVNMDMVDALSGRRPNIYTDIVGIRLELRIDELLLFLDQLHAGGDLFGCQLKKLATCRFGMTTEWPGLTA